jgi:hypothetical protein
MVNPDSNSEQQHLEEIVAYLDGELSEVETAQVEERLSVDQSYRRQMQEIDRAWNALDELPGVTVDDTFSKTTMELVVGTARQEVQDRTMALPRLRRRRSMVVGALIVAAAMVGFFGFQLIRSNPNATLVADLPVIVHVDIYSQFAEIQFLRDLRQAFQGISWKDQEPTDELARLKEQFQAVAPEENRREWLRQRTREEKTALRSKYNRFDSLTPDRRKQLRALHQELVSANKSDLLLDTMLRYQGWLQDLPPSRKYQLRDMKREQRIKEIVQEIKRRGHGPSIELTDEQYANITRKFRALILTGLDPGQRGRLAGMEERRQLNYLLRMRHQQPKEIRDELRKIIAETLTDQQQSQFKQSSESQQRDLVSAWLRSVRSHGEVTQKDLEEYFANELDAAVKEKLLALPRDQMQRRLRWLYLGMDERQWKEGDDPGPPGATPGPPHGRPPRGPGLQSRHPGSRQRGKLQMRDGPRREGSRRDESRND